MADWTQNISNSVGVFGFATTSKWGDANGPGYTMVWGTTLWGEGSYDVVVDIQKLIANSILPDTIIINDVLHAVDLGSTLLTSDISKESFHLIGNDLSVTGDLSSEKLSQGSWNYVFPSNTDELETRTFVTFTCGSVSGFSYTCQAAGSTTWS